MCENKLHRNLTEVVYTDKSLIKVEEDLKNSSVYYETVIRPDPPIIISLLGTITVPGHPKNISDLCFPESFTITENGWTFYDGYGNLLAHDGKWTWMCLQENWREPGVTTPLKDSLLERGWLQ